MWELDYKESWAPKNWCFWTVVLEKTLESPLDCKEIQPVHLKGDQSWVFIGRSDAKAETPIFWPPDVKNWLIGKDPDAGKDWRQDEKRMKWLDGINNMIDRSLRVVDGQGNLACCSPWDCKDLDTTEWLNWTELESQINRCSNQGYLLCPFVNYLIQNLLDILHAYFCQYSFLYLYISLLKLT